MINIENLRKIYNFISDLPDERVNMLNWRTSKIGFAHSRADLNVCGTAACVVGWLPVIFNEETPLNFLYDQFANKVDCTYGEAKVVCNPSLGYEVDDNGYYVDDIPRTKQDALQSMRELATAYGHTI